MSRVTKILPWFSTTVASLCYADCGYIFTTKQWEDGFVNLGLVGGFLAAGVPLIFYLIGWLCFGNTANDAQPSAA